MPQFTAPGAAFTDEYIKALTDAANQRRQAMLDELTVQREGRLREQTDASIENTRENTASLKDQRAAAAKLAGIQAEQAEQNLIGGRYRRGDVMQPGDASRVPGLASTPLAQDTLPGRSTVDVNVPLTPIDQDKAGEQTFLGTPQERALAELRTSGGLRPEQAQTLEAMGAFGDKSLPANFGELGKDTSEPLMRVNPEKGNPEIYQNGQWVSFTGNGVPKNARMLQQTREPQAGGGREPAPFVITQQRADGTYLINGRTGDVISRADRPLGDSAGQAVALAQTNLETADSILNQVKPEWVGQWDGRWKSVQEAVTGGDPAFTAFSAATSSLRNAFINMRTGAAMSEPEATRIITELSDVKQPINTYVARVKNAQAYLHAFLKNRVAVGTGRALTPGNVDVITGQPMGGQTTPSGKKRTVYDLQGNPVAAP